jgi:hypothetical protein
MTDFRRNHPRFWVLQAVLGGFVVSCYLVIFTCWIYRLIWPPDESLRQARYAAWNKEQLSFWSSWREAEMAEREYRMKMNQRSNGHRADGSNGVGPS